MPKPHRVHESQIYLADRKPCRLAGPNLSQGYNPGLIDTRCGLSCVNCVFRERTGCGGCIATKGHPFHGECSVAICCQNKGFLHCGEGRQGISVLLSKG